MLTHGEDDIALLEAQKERERSWVKRGAEAFLKAVSEGEPGVSPAGKRLMKMCFERYRERLGRFMDETADSPRPWADALFPVLSAVDDTTHVAAVVITTAINLVLSAGPDIEESTVVAFGSTLGRALEHDIVWRIWAFDREKAVIERMKKTMAGNPKAWRERAAKLRHVGTEPWSNEDAAVVGINLLGLLTEACPDVFVCPNVRYGHHTQILFKLNEDVADTLTRDTYALACAKPRYGFMLVKPRPWRYVDEPSTNSRPR